MRKVILFIVKAQLKYMVHNLGYNLIFLLLILVSGYFREDKVLNFGSMLLFVLYSLGVVFIKKNENRHYVYSTLPITKLQIAISRIILILISFITIYLTSLLLYMLGVNSELINPLLVQELMMGGLMVLTIMFLYLSTAVYLLSLSRKRKQFATNIFVFVYSYKKRESFLGYK